MMSQSGGRERDAMDDRKERDRRERLSKAFALLNPDERQLLTCALAGNHPSGLASLRMPVLRALARAERGWERS